VTYEAPRGTHDILPSEQPRWRQVIGEFEELCALYGYRRIDTPVFEDTELFARTSGEGSDVVTKEMYTFEDRSGRSLTLRAEATAPIVRAYLEHGLHREPQPQKLYTHTTIYRYGRPQKGRFREHWQLDAEAIGSEDPALDAEVIQLYDALLGRLGVTEYTLELNSIGDGECRPAYLAALKPWLAEHEAELDEATREQARRNPLRALDNIAAKPPAVQEVLGQAPTIHGFLCEACRAHFTDVRTYLDATGVRYELVPTLVRGLDYYTRTTWEFVGAEGASTSTLSGGGRYDGLAEALGGRPTPGVGFGAGIERLILALDEGGIPLAEPAGIDVFFVCESGADRAGVLAKLAELRAAGVRADADFAGRSVKGQRTQASRLGAERVVVVGADTDLSEVTP
jgi:histidyl-tRNA synthetase